MGVLGEEDEVAGLIDGDLEEKTLNGFGFGRSTTLPEKEMIINWIKSFKKTKNILPI